MEGVAGECFSHMIKSCDLPVSKWRKRLKMCKLSQLKVVIAISDLYKSD